MIFGYARVSTQDQNLETQIAALEKYGCDKIYYEKLSGKIKNRPELDKCLDIMREGDTLVIYKLDRLGRTLRNLVNLVNDLSERKIKFVSISDGIDVKTIMGKALFQMCGVFAEMEHALILERSRAGIENARRRGRIGGRKPKLAPLQVKAVYQAYIDPETDLDELCTTYGISRRTLSNYVKRYEIDQNKSNSERDQLLTKKLTRGKQ
jgi:DNA invertase Pin-like site-specific DNA recombinase